MVQRNALSAYASIVGSSTALLSTFSVSEQAVFLPLNPENTAAKKHKIAANMKAVVRAVINGDAMAFGKKVWLVRVVRVL
jgi:hypothetical protein